MTLIRSATDQRVEGSPRTRLRIGLRRLRESSAKHQMPARRRARAKEQDRVGERFSAMAALFPARWGPPKVKRMLHRFRPHSGLEGFTSALLDPDVGKIRNILARDLPAVEEAAVGAISDVPLEPVLEVPDGVIACALMLHETLEADPLEPKAHDGALVWPEALLPLVRCDLPWLEFRIRRFELDGGAVRPRAEECVPRVVLRGVPALLREYCDHGG